MQNTNIEWADMTWNPVSGCSKVSAGCKFCYAETIYKRFHSRLGDFNKITLHPEKLGEPFRHKKPKRIFVNSMSDLFHEDVPFEFIAQVFWTMAQTPQHTYMVLTKRPERLLEFSMIPIVQRIDDGVIPFEKAYPNVLVGVSVENQEQANVRLPYLNLIQSAVKFVSAEPLIGRIDFETALGESLKWHAGGLKNCISWVIAGGESGHHARPMHPEWVRSLRDQCERAGVPFFFKQWGEWLPHRMPLTSSQINVLPNYSKNLYKEIEQHNMAYVKVGKKKAGNTLDGWVHLEFPKPTQP